MLIQCGQYISKLNMIWGITIIRVTDNPVEECKCLPTPWVMLIETNGTQAGVTAGQLFSLKGLTKFVFKMKKKGLLFGSSQIRGKEWLLKQLTQGEHYQRIKIADKNWYTVEFRALQIEDKQIFKIGTVLQKQLIRMQSIKLERKRSFFANQSRNQKQKKIQVPAQMFHVQIKTLGLERRSSLAQKEQQGRNLLYSPKQQGRFQIPPSGSKVTVIQKKSDSQGRSQGTNLGSYGRIQTNNLIAQRGIQAITPGLQIQSRKQGTRIQANNLGLQGRPVPITQEIARRQASITGKIGGKFVQTLKARQSYNFSQVNLMF